MEKKHLVYAEDLIYEIMQYPSRSLSKGLISICAKKIIKEKEVSIWKYICDQVKEFFRR